MRAAAAVLCAAGAAAVVGAAAVPGAATVVRTGRAALRTTGASPAGPGTPAPTPGPPLGVSAPAAAPDVAYAVTCDDGQSFRGTLGGTGTASGTGAASHGPIPAGTRCTARLAPTGGLPGLTEALPPVPASGVVTVRVTENLPGIILDPALGPPGQPTAVSGAGFPPHAPVTLTWNVGQGAPLSVTTDARGRFSVSDLVLPGSPQGLAQLAAGGAGFPTVAAAYLVVPPTVEPQGDNPLHTVFRP